MIVRRVLGLPSSAKAYRISKKYIRLRNMKRIISALCALNTVPTDENAFANWLELGDAIEFLNENAEAEEFVLFAQAPHVFIYAVLVPEPLLNPPDVEDLMSWDCHPSQSWTTATTFSEPPTISIEGPLAYDRSKTMAQGEQLVFSRDFDGRTGEKNEIEILQKLVHLMDLHFLPERRAYCRLNNLGDLEDVIRIKGTSSQSEGFEGALVTIQRSTFDEYLALNGSAAVRVFDFTRFRRGQFGGWSHPPNLKEGFDGALYYHKVVEPRHASYIRGFQIVKSKTLKADIARRYIGSHSDRKQYASVIAYDFKNDIVNEISLAPGETANYFTESELPFEMSPAFFRPEVLSKYKTDSDKYRLSDRSIFCRGGWHLQTYDINEAGQVHTYLVYLRSLPYEEQLHWKAYNEPPKAPIAERALKADFEGSWDIKIDSLNELKHLLLDLKKDGVPWWTLRSEKLIDQVNYPVTSSADEWSNEILLLDQLVVEGFEEKYLRQQASSFGRQPDQRLRSLQLVEECLNGLSYEEEQVKKLVAPLRELHTLRSKLKGHASGDSAVEIRKQVLTKYGTYQQHFQSMCGECTDSIRAIAEAFKGLVPEDSPK